MKKQEIVAKEATLQHKLLIENLKKEFAEETQKHIDNSKQLKAYNLRYSEENKLFKDEISEHKERIHTLMKDISECHIELEEKSNIIKEV